MDGRRWDHTLLWRILLTNSMEQEPKIVDVEVVAEPPLQQREPLTARATSARNGRFEGPPIHPLSALLLMVIDGLWTLPELLVVDWVITIPLCFITVLVPTLMIQKLIKKQTFGAAFVYAVLLAMLAAVPYPLLGTPIGAAMLAWFGISKLWGGQDKAVP